ncbi:MAG: ATP-dependent Clp protease proteolytic subunit [Bacteroidetes bacterium]|nr:ATP-dependent Clp protease proteolytic subunit [Bacteroidota bacterium]
MYKDRISLYKQLEDYRNTKILVYITGDRPGLETQIHSEVLNYFTEHLDKINDSKKISLFLYSRGGDTLAGWSIVNLVRQFCNEFEVIIPFKAHSTATLISLGADKIVMTKQATLSPIDPSINTPLNPQLPGAPPQQRYPVSVEAIAGYFDLAKNMLGIEKAEQLSDAFLKLSEHIHPIALGNVYRARTQIQQLAEKLLNYHMNLTGKDSKKIISFLCSESGSHDYTINRKEASDLGLPIEKPDTELYGIIKNIYDDINKELSFGQQFVPEIELGQDQQKNFSAKRALLESLSGGSNYYCTEGLLERKAMPPQLGQQPFVNHLTVFQINFQGWKYES